MKKRLNTWLSGLLPQEPGRRMTALLLLGCGVFLLLWSLLPSGGSQPETAAEDLSAYTAELESRTEILLRQVRGAGAVHVMITLEGGTTTRYQTDSSLRETTGSEGDTDYQKEDTVAFGQVDGDDQPLVTENREPVVRGVAVICEGAGDPAVEAAVLQTVTRLFSISTTQVSVVAGVAKS